MILSHIQIEEIAAAVTKDFNEFFFGGRAAFETHYAQATPIDQRAGDYLGLRVSFAHLSDDGSICGLTAYTDTEYAATCQGVTRLIPLKANEVLLDSSFMEPGQVRARCGSGGSPLPMSAPTRFCSRWSLTRRGRPAGRPTPPGPLTPSVT